MSAVCLDIRDALVAVLNAQSWTKEFTAVTGYVPRYQLKDMDTLHVTVVASNIESEREARNLRQEEYEVQVGIQQRFSAEAADCDALVALGQEIGDYLFANPALSGYPAAALWKWKFYPYYAEDLVSRRQYTGVLVLTYRVDR